MSVQSGSPVRSIPLTQVCRLAQRSFWDRLRCETQTMAYMADVDPMLAGLSFPQGTWGNRKSGDK